MSKKKAKQAKRHAKVKSGRKALKLKAQRAKRAPKASPSRRLAPVGKTTTSGVFPI